MMQQTLERVIDDIFVQIEVLTVIPIHEIMSRNLAENQEDDHQQQQTDLVDSGHEIASRPVCGDHGRHSPRDSVFPPMRKEFFPMRDGAPIRGIHVRPSQPGAEQLHPRGLA